MSALAWADVADDYIWLSKSEKRKRMVGKKPTIVIEKSKTGKDRIANMMKLMLINQVRICNHMCKKSVIKNLKV